ncbi:MAG: hypothetical protein V1651_00920 [Patescibacteria group bacterium]
MNKLTWILIIGVVIIAGVYFVVTKNNNTSNEPEPISTEQQDTKTTVSPPQNTQTKTPTKPATNNTGGIPQPPKLPE